MNNQDSMYYRNRDTIANMNSCSHYKSMLSYSSCTEDKVQKTKPVDREIKDNKSTKTTEGYGKPGDSCSCGAKGGCTTKPLNKQGTWQCKNDQKGICSKFCMT